MLNMSESERCIWIKKARDEYQDGRSIEIDSNAAVLRSDNGVYVHAWVYVADEEGAS